MKFNLQNYNEFKNGVRWHDYISVMINEFSIILLRRYDEPHSDSFDPFIIFQILGFMIFNKKVKH